MKPKKLYLLFLLCSLKVFSFQQKDSLSYYVEIYDKADNINKLIKPLKFFERDKLLSLTKKYNQRAAYDLYYISKIQYKFGDLYSSEKSSVEGLGLLDSLPFDDTIKDSKKSFYNHLGILRRDLKHYDDSQKYFYKALSLSQNKWDSALAYNNISINLIIEKNYTSAKQKLLISFKSFEELKDSSYMALSINNLGLTQSKLNEREALHSLERGLQIRKLIKDPRIYESYKFIVNHFLDRENTAKAKLYAKKAYEQALKFNSLSFKYEALSDLIKLGENKYAEEFRQTASATITSNELKRDTYALAKYNIKGEQEKRRMVELEKEKEKSQRITIEAKREKEKILYITLAGIILLSSVFLYFYLKTRHKKDKLKQRFQTEQQISKRLHDEVANDVYFLMNKVQNENTVSNELVDNLEDIYLKTRDISKANADIDVSKDFDVLLSDMVVSYKTKNVNIFTANISDIIWEEVAKDKKRTLYRVIQELMTNMKKHSKASLVTIHFEKWNQKLKITYVDNGSGSALKKGNGLQNMENRIEMIGGTITFESEAGKGFQAQIII